MVSFAVGRAAVVGVVDETEVVVVVGVGTAQEVNVEGGEGIGTGRMMNVEVGGGIGTGRMIEEMAVIRVTATAAGEGEK